ncbi:prepilin-type N-terminal cleavage/methylation domain-containing protein [Oceanisphaera psychrotolerans]|nr:prepilin-type N-terminal cleavage/methylation domain-containing protein [Oceanisphaera psychrotolerans]
MLKLNKNGGFSVVEMLVSLVAGLVVVAGAFPCLPPSWCPATPP